MKGFLQHFLQYLLEEDYLLLMNLFVCVLFSLWMQYFKMILQTLQMNLKH